MPKKTAPPEPAALEAGLGRVSAPTAAETEADHVAFLLWAMQDPRRRGFVQLSRAVGRPKGGLTYTAVRWCWRERIGRLGTNVDRDAAMMYRDLYVGSELWGRRPLDVIHAIVRAQAWLLLDVGMPEPPIDVAVPGTTTGLGREELEKPASNATSDEKRIRAGNATREVQARLRAEAALEAQQRAVREAKERQERQEAERARVGKVYRTALGVLEGYVQTLGSQLLAKDAKGNPIPVQVRPRDLPMILEQHREVSELLGIIQPTVQSGPASEPSYRVQLATASGGDVLQAMVDDVEECRIILLAMRDRRDSMAQGVDLSEEDPAAGPQLLVEAPEEESAG